MTQNNAQGEYLLLPLEAISLDPNNPRKVNPNDPVFQQELDALAETIKELGVIEPVIVKQTGDNTYELMAGERRYRACQLLQLATIPAVVRSYDESAEIFVKVVENVARSSLNDIEVWNAVKQIQTHAPEMSRAEIARRIGRTPTYINRIELLCENADYFELFNAGLLAPSMVFQAEAFRKKPDGEQQWRKIVDHAYDTETVITARVLKQATPSDEQAADVLTQQTPIATVPPDTAKMLPTTSPIKSANSKLEDTNAPPFDVDDDDDDLDRPTHQIMMMSDTERHPRFNNLVVLSEEGEVLEDGGYLKDVINKKPKEAKKNREPKKASEPRDTEPVYRFKIKVTRFRALLRKLGFEAFDKKDDVLRNEFQEYLDNF